MESSEAHEAARALLAEAPEVVRSLDPSGIAAHDLRECLLSQIRQQEHEFDLIFGEADGVNRRRGGCRHRVARSSVRPAQIIDQCLPLLQKRDLTALGRAVSKPQEHVPAGHRPYPDARSAPRPALQPQRSAAHRAGCRLRQARRRIRGRHERRRSADAPPQPGLPQAAGAGQTPSEKSRNMSRSATAPRCS